jgi:PAS domain S-box-containing protein
VLSAVCSSKNITERHRADYALRESEERFRAFMENMPSMVIIKDKELRPLFFNRKFSETFPAKDWLGKTPEETFTPEIANSMRANDLKALREGFVTYEEEWYDKDDCLRVLETRKFAIAQEDKEPLLGVIITDNTDRKRADAALMERTGELDRIFSLSLDMLCVADINGYFRRLNPEWESTLGYKLDELEGKIFLDFVHPDDLESTLAAVSDLSRGKQVLNFTNRYRAKDGTYRWIEWRSAPYQDKLIYASARDITERKRTEEELGINKDRLSRAEIISGSGNWEFDLESKRVFASEGARKIYGLQNAEWTIPEVQKIPLPEYREMLDRALQGLVKENRRYDVEFKIRRPDSGEIADIHSVAEFDCNRKVVFGIIQDITDRKKIEEALRESQQRLSDIIEFLPDATLVIDREGKVIAWNRAIESMTGTKAEEMLGKGDYEYAHPFYGERRPILIDLALHPDPEKEKSYTTILRKGDIIIGEAYTPALAPGNVHLSATASVLRNSKGEVIAAIECIRNNTDRKNMEERLQRAEKMEALGVLAGGVAHDMNNILGVLVGYSELLLREVPEESRACKYAKSILQGAERAAAIIQDLLTMARRGVSVSEAVNLNKIVVDSFKTPEFELAKSRHPNVIFRSQVAKDLFNIKGSPVHLSKTIMNLLLNAAESIRGTGMVTITTENRYVDVAIPGYENTQEGDYVVLTVTDTGAGISPADMGRIFEPFYTKKIMGRSGTGLGLAVVWGTIKDHGGYIDVRSEENEGSTFTLYFPVSREASSTQDMDFSPDSYQGRGENILIVDDVEAQRSLAATILESLNYRVTTAVNGEAAVEYLRTNKADLIVLDMIMDPGIDGLETYRRILEIQPMQKAIIVSGFAKTDRVSKAQELGAGEYVKKPYVIEKLGIAVRKELDRKWSKAG